MISLGCTGPSLPHTRCLQCDLQRLLYCGAWLLTVAASLAVEHPLQGAHTSVVGVHRLRCSVACGIPQTRDQSCVPCIGRWILNHCMSREVPGLNLSKELDLVSERKYSSAHKVNGGWRIFKNYSKGSPRMAGKSSHGKINETRSQTQN